MHDHDAQDRLNRVLAGAGIAGGDSATRLDSESGDVWSVGGLVIRIGWRGDVERYARENTLVRSLPPGLRHPEVVDAGRDGDLAWMVTRHVAGDRLDRVWHTLDAVGQDRVVAQLGEALRGLHSWTPPEAVATTLRDHAADAPRGTSALVGTDICPLPVERAIGLATYARSLPHADGDLIDSVVDRLERLAPHDPYGRRHHGTVVHGDLHFANVLCRDGAVAAVLDFEWSRLGPIDQDLEPFLRSVDWAGAGDSDLIAPAEMSRILGRLAAEYPALFGASDLVQRLWLYQLAYTTRALFTRPADHPPDRLAPNHPRNLLPRFVDGSAHPGEPLRRRRPGTARARLIEVVAGIRRAGDDRRVTLQAEADELYGLLPEEFIAARNAQAKAARAGGDRQLADRIRKLPKPRRSAWVLNVLVRRLPDEVDRLVVLGEQLREAQTGLAPDGLRALDHQRRQLTGALTRQARTIAAELGHQVSDELAAEIENTLRAAMADPAGGAALRTGLLVDSFGTTGIERVEVDQVVAVPDAVSGLSEPTTPTTPIAPVAESPPTKTPPAPPPRRLAVVREPAPAPKKASEPDRAQQQAEEALRKARETLERAREAVGEADRALTEATQSHADAADHREQLETERKTLQERLRTVDRELTRATRAEDRSERERERAERAHSGAQRDLRRAESRVERTAER